MKAVAQLRRNEPEASPFGLGFAHDGRARVLCIDADPELLETIKRIFNGRYELHLASSPYAAMATLEEDGPFAVLVSDLSIPGLDGIELLDLAQRLAPATQRIILSGTADLSVAIDAVNRSHVFGFLTKPVDPGQLRDRIDDAAAEHRRLTYERNEAESTMRGCAQAMVEMLSLANSGAGQLTQRVERLAELFTSRNPSPLDWEIRMAASLSQIGCAGLGTELSDRLLLGKDLSEAEILLASCVPSFTMDILARIPGIEIVLDIVRDHRIPNHVAARPGTDVSHGARVLNICVHVAEMEATGQSPETVAAILRSDYSEYDHDLVSKFLEIYAPIGVPDLVLPKEWIGTPD